MNNLVYTDRIKEERKKKDLSYKDMAKLLGYKSKSTYMNIERGKITPKLLIMHKVSKILEKPVAYFFKIEVQ